MIRMFLYLQLYQQTATIHKNVKHKMTLEDFHVILGLKVQLALVRTAKRPHLKAHTDGHMMHLTEQSLDIVSASSAALLDGCELLGG